MPDEQTSVVPARQRFVLSALILAVAIGTSDLQRDLAGRRFPDRPFITSG